MSMKKAERKQSKKNDEPEFWEELRAVKDTS